MTRRHLQNIIFTQRKLYLPLSLSLSTFQKCWQSFLITKYDKWCENVLFAHFLWKQYIVAASRRRFRHFNSSTIRRLTMIVWIICYCRNHLNFKFSSYRVCFKWLQNVCLSVYLVADIFGGRMRIWQKRSRGGFS